VRVAEDGLGCAVVRVQVELAADEVGPGLFTGPHDGNGLLLALAVALLNFREIVAGWIYIIQWHLGYIYMQLYQTSVISLKSLEPIISNTKSYKRCTTVYIINNRGSSKLL